MKEAFEFIKGACDFVGVIPSDAMVSVSSGRLEARNPQLTASQPVQGFKDFSVPAVDLDYELRRAPEGAVISVTDHFVTFKAPTGVTKIKRLLNREPFKKPEIKTTPISDVEDLMGAIDDVFPFTAGDPAKPWSQGARFDVRTLTATNSVTLCRAELTSQAGFDAVTLSRTALAYLRLRREALVAWGSSAHGTLFEFEDDGWAFAPRLAAEMPDQAVNLIDKLVDPAAWGALQPVTSEYRDAFLSSVDRTESILTIFPDHIFGARLASERVCPVETKLGNGVEKALFSAKDLTTVIQKAARIGFDKFPAPVPFVTARGSKGLLAGRST